ncbi:Polyhydroxyalkanoic acid system protein [Burkholderiales bacterium 8X]|nr:Polyhydroxyalkanoic acid system protein [Burkholderiales bacterium 8X]
MSDIHIDRKHRLGLPAAREVARRWLQEAEAEYGLSCSYTPGDTCDQARFSRAGVDGSFDVTADSFRLQAELGFLVSAFGGQIEQKLNRKLDALLGSDDSASG